MKRFRNLEDSVMTRVKDKLIMFSCKFKRTNLMKSVIKVFRSHNRYHKKSLKYKRKKKNC